MTFKTGKKRTGGRKSGSRNKGTVEIKLLSQQYTVEALAGLVEIARDALAPHAVRVQAWNSVLDRGHGKPPIAVESDGGKVGLITVQWLGEDQPESPLINGSLTADDGR